MASAPRRGRGRRDRRAGLLVGSGLVVFVGVTYLVFVVGAGAFIREDEGSANVALSALATTVVVVAFESVRGGLHRLVHRVLHLPPPAHLAAVRDEERNRLKRDLHDGAQQRLVAMAVNLRLAQRLIRTAPERAVKLLDEQAFAARQAIESLERLCRGMPPQYLTEQGVASAVRAATADGPLRVVVTERAARRAAAEVEAALYFCCLEALQNAAKHAQATHAWVDVGGAADGGIQLTVRDDGRGFDPSRVRGGAGLANMRQRIDAVGGRFELRSAPSAGVRLEVRVTDAARARGTGRPRWRRA